MTGALWRNAFVSTLFALHPSHVESVAWVAERKVEAMTHFAEAIRFKPDYAEAYYKIGLILTQKRKIKAAEDFFKKAILLDPDYKAARHRLDILKKGENDRKRKGQKKF